MGTYAAQLGMQAANTAVSGLIGGGMGMLFGKWNDERQLEQQQALQELQIKGQKEMGIFNRKQALQMWKDTNYSAQKEELEKAGLNPGLLYGMSGGGGATASTSPGNVSGGTAPQGGGELQQMTGMALQFGKLQAEIGLLKAQAANVNTDTENKAGVERQEGQTRIQMLEQGIDNARQLNEIQKLEITLRNIENFEKQASQKDRLDYIQYQTAQAMKQLELVKNEAYISSETVDQKIKIIQQEAIGAVLRNAFTEQQTKVGEAQIKNWAEQIANAKEQLSINEAQLRLQQTVEEIKANFPSIGETLGRLINDGVESIFDLTPRGRKVRYKTPTGKN